MVGFGARMAIIKDLLLELLYKLVGLSAGQIISSPSMAGLIKSPDCTITLPLFTYKIALIGERNGLTRSPGRKIT